MILHRKHHILSKIRNSILLGDNLDEAIAHCAASGFNMAEINDTLSLYENFGLELNMKSPNFWELLTRLIFDFAWQIEAFQNLIKNSDSNELEIDLSMSSEGLLFIDPFRLLDICSYSGYQLFLKIPTSVFEEFKSHKRKVTLEEFDKIQHNRKLLGLNGELFVLQEESKRLGDEFPIEHTSQVDVAAGYDIKSWKNSSTYLKSNRLYIEVKTFSIQKEIFISQNELQVAKNLGEYYRLHIVRKNGNTFENYQIIDNFYDFYSNNKSSFEVQPTFRYQFE